MKQLLQVALAIAAIATLVSCAGADQGEVGNFEEPMELSQLEQAASPASWGGCATTVGCAYARCEDKCVDLGYKFGFCIEYCFCRMYQKRPKLTCYNQAVTQIEVPTDGAPNSSDFEVPASSPAQFSAPATVSPGSSTFAQ